MAVHPSFLLSPYTHTHTHTHMISHELYCRWAHVQPLARCLSGQATAAENKDLRLPLQAFCDSEGIPVTLLAIQNIVPAPSTRGSEGLLVRSL